MHDIKTEFHVSHECSIFFYTWTICNLISKYEVVWGTYHTLTLVDAIFTLFLIMGEGNGWKVKSVLFNYIRLITDWKSQFIKWNYWKLHCHFNVYFHMAVHRSGRQSGKIKRFNGFFNCAQCSTFIDFYLTAHLLGPTHALFGPNVSTCHKFHKLEIWRFHSIAYAWRMLNIWPMFHTED